MIIKKYLILLTIVSIGFSPGVQAQSDVTRKLSMNLSGQVYDGNGHVLGWISKDGIVQNAIDDRIAVIDKDGVVLDKTGKKIGHVDAHGSYYDSQESLVFTVGEPKGHQCEIVDQQGKIEGSVHEHYKNQAFAIHCLYASINGH
jgi:Protein of unknown function (DUF3659)